MIRGFPGGSADTPANTGDIGLILGSGRCKEDAKDMATPSSILPEKAYD